MNSDFKEDIDKMSPREFGRWGEKFACDYLEKEGYEIIERNWHFSRYGEIDIIAIDGSSENRDKNNLQLVFIEVKARRKVWSGHPLEAINRVKLNKIRKICSAWNEGKFPKGASSKRIDSIGIQINDEFEPEVIHLKGVC